MRGPHLPPHPPHPPLCLARPPEHRTLANTGRMLTVVRAAARARCPQLVPVTQLYVSVDAATPETLKQVDRPLFSDYW